MTAWPDASFAAAPSGVRGIHAAEQAPAVHILLHLLHIRNPHHYAHVSYGPLTVAMEERNFVLRFHFSLNYDPQT